MVVVVFLLLVVAMAPVAMSQEVLLPLPSVSCDSHQIKASNTPLSLPFFDDFAGYNGEPNANLWRSKGGYVNTGYGEQPPTIGMLTLDALDANGNLYAAASTSIFSADTVASLPIRLDSLSADDSLVFSFYYLPGGGYGNMWERVGDTPDEYDSLILEFYNASEDKWVMEWSTGGVSVDTLLVQTGRAWQYVAIAIRDTHYLDSLFAFRFRNYCSLDENTKPGMVGNVDQWNIDYILLNRGRELEVEPSFRDVAFVEPATSMLTNYVAMPARQYRHTDMAANTHATITNLYSSPLATQYTYVILNADGDTLHHYDGGYENAPPYLPTAEYQSAPAHASAAVDYAFPESNQQREYTIVHTIREGVGGDAFTANDTTVFQQRFLDYFAYDDGIPENGYGITSTSQRIYLAYRFDLNVPDTLTAVAMYFNRTRNNENAQVPFYLSVWSNEEGHPGVLLYRDEVARMPVIDGFNRYHRYVLESPLLVSGSIFVGFEQASNVFINMGFDRSNNSSDRIYYLTSSEWQQSILSGSLMLRPYFGRAATVDLPSIVDSALQPTLAPNPASHRTILNNVSAGLNIIVTDTYGRKVLTTTCTSSTLELNTSNWPSGLYIVRSVDAVTGHSATLKLLIRH